MFPEFKRRGGRERIRTHGLEQAEIGVTLRLGDELTFSIPNRTLSVRVYRLNGFSGQAVGQKIVENSNRLVWPGKNYAVKSRGKESNKRPVVVKGKANRKNKA